MGASPSATDAAAQAMARQVRTTFGVARLDDLAVLEVTGPDAPTFLQNRLSNDVLALQPGQGQLNAALDRQGKIQAVFVLLRHAGGYRLLMDKAWQAEAVAQILKFRILEQIGIAPLEGAQVFSIQGPRAQAFLEGLGVDEFPGHELDWLSARVLGQSGWLIRLTQSSEIVFTFVVDDPALDFERRLRDLALEADGVALSEPAREILRVEAGIPRAGKDYNLETLLPETGLERETVSYTKGCYLGQETVARIKTYGMVQKALCGLLFEPACAPPPEGAELRLEGRPAGEITSVVFSPTLERPIAMAYLGKAERVPGRRLNLEIAGARYAAEVCLLPFVDSRAEALGGRELLDAGLKLFSDGYDEEAIRKLRGAIEAQPDLVEAYEALGVILSRQEAYDEAIALMQRVLALDPDHVLAHTNLSVYYMKLGDKDKAEEEKALATTAAFRKKMRESGLPFDPVAHELEERRKKEQATLEKIAMFTEALKFNPADALGNFGLGSCYLELKRYEEAIPPLEKTLAAQPKHSAAWLALGKACEGAGQTDKALETYRKGIEVAAARGDLMPLQEMQSRLRNLGADA